MNLINLRGWAHGIASAFICGAASAGIDALSHLTSGSPISERELLRIALIGGVGMALTYLKQSPLPPKTGNLPANQA